MINFNDIPCDIKKIIYAINKKREIEEYNNNKLKFNSVINHLQELCICEDGWFHPCVWWKRLEWITRWERHEFRQLSIKERKRHRRNTIDSDEEDSE